jgi:uncharacterized protein YecT (DUF1311 family)
MRPITFTLALAVGLIFFSRTVAGGETQGERLQKAKQNFAVADAALNKTFQALRRKLPAGKFQELRDQQRKWLEYRDYIAADQPRQNDFRGNDPKQSDHYWDAMADLTEARTKFLQASFDSTLPKGITGFYEDSYGGSLSLEERADGLAFEIDVVRGPTLHTGGLAGLATLKGDTALYQEQLEPGEDREPCEMTFSFSNGHRVIVEGKNTEHHHGARAYFVGMYFKTAKLDKPIDLNAPED